MKRIASTCVLLAGFGGGCVSPDGGKGTTPDAAPRGFGQVTTKRVVPGVQGPTGEPVVSLNARGVAPTGGGAPGYARVSVPAAPAAPADGGVQQVNWNGDACPPGGAHIPGGGLLRNALHHPGLHRGVRPASAEYLEGPRMPLNPPGILPVPAMGPPGAVAAVGAIVPGMMPVPTNQRSSIRFGGPAGMSVTWQLPGGAFTPEAQALTAPASYNFLQGQVYRLRMTRILPNHPGKVFYPTLEVVPANPKTVTFLAHSSVPVVFTPEDFDQVAAGNLVVKVVYLPDPTFQDYATVAGAEEIVSTRLEPGADPVVEAQKRGSILAVIRMGNIDLENPVSPGMTAPPAGGLPPGMIPPGMVPPGALPLMAPPGIAPPLAAPKLLTPPLPAPVPSKP